MKQTNHLAVIVAVMCWSLDTSCPLAELLSLVSVVGAALAEPSMAVINAPPASPATSIHLLSFSI